MRPRITPAGILALLAVALVAPALLLGPVANPSLPRLPNETPTRSGPLAAPTLGASVPPRFGAAGVTAVANITVGTQPEGIAYDPASGEVFVANYASDNVSVINDTTDHVVATIRVGGGPGNGPEGVSYDPRTGDIYVPNYLTGNVSVLNGTTNALLATLSLTAWKSLDGVAYDSRSGATYAADLSGTLYPIARGGLTGPPTPLPTPLGEAYDPAQGEMFVTDLYSSNVSIVNTTANVLVRTVPVGPPVPPLPGVEPEGIAYDYGHGEMFVVNYISNNVTVLNDSRNATVANITLLQPPCFDPITPAYDARTGEVFVTCNSATYVAIINDTNDTNYALAPVGAGPYSDVWDSGHGEIFVTNDLSNNVTVLAVRSVSSAVFPVTFTETGLPGGTNWSVTFAGATRSSTGSSIGFTSPNGTFGFTVRGVPGYVATPASGTVVVNGTKVVVTILWAKPAVYPLTFRETGLLTAGLTWTVTVTGLGGVVTKNNTTYRPPPIVPAQGWIVFLQPNGSATFSVTAPAGWGVASVSGTRVTSFTTVSVKGPTTVLVHFGRLRGVTFYEPPPSTPTGGVLPPGTVWGVRLVVGGRLYAPPPPPVNTTGSSLAFTLPTGDHYGYRVAKPSIYRASPPRGSFTVPGTNSSIPIGFYLLAVTVDFVEKNLALGTKWGVNVTGPANASLNATSTSLAVALPNGTYTFTVWNFSALHPHPATGTIVVVAPHARVTVVIRYT